LMVHEVEIDLEAAVAMGDQTGGEAPGRDVERGVPPVVHQRRVGQTHLADDLGHELERVPGVLPGLEVQLGPGRRWFGGAHACGPYRRIDATDGGRVSRRWWRRRRGWRRSWSRGATPSRRVRLRPR